MHSPAVGPCTWRWVAGALRSLGYEVITPNLVAAAREGDPVLFARAAAEAVQSDDEVVIVGHSAAGTLLPLVAELTPAVRRIVFVDATVPPCAGRCTAGGDFLPALQNLATDGLLPVWSEWWGQGVMDALVQDGARRHEIEAELPRVPLTFFEVPIPLPVDWCETDGGVLLLSEFYRSDADRAAALGWPVIERSGAHLDMANEEEEIAANLVELARHPIG